MVEQRAHKNIPVRGDVVEVEGRFGIVLRKHIDYPYTFLEVLVGIQKIWYTPDETRRYQWRRSRLADGFPYCVESGVGKRIENDELVISTWAGIKDMSASGDNE